MKQFIMVIVMLLVVLSGSVFAGTTSERRAEAVIDYMEYVLDLWEAVPAAHDEELEAAINETEVLLEMIDDWESIYEQELNDYYAGGDWVPNHMMSTFVEGHIFMISTFGEGQTFRDMEHLFNTIKGKYSSARRAKESGDFVRNLEITIDTQMLAAWGNTLQWGNSPSDPYKGYEILDFLNPDGSGLPTGYDDYGMDELLEEMIKLGSEMLAYFEKGVHTWDDVDSTDTGGVWFTRPEGHWGGIYHGDSNGVWANSAGNAGNSDDGDYVIGLILQDTEQITEEELKNYLDSFLKEREYTSLELEPYILDVSYPYVSALTVVTIMYWSGGDGDDGYVRHYSMSHYNVFYLSGENIYHLSCVGFTEDEFIEIAESVQLP